MVAVLSRLLLHRPSLGQLTRSLARSARHAKQRNRPPPVKSSKSPVIQTTKQFMFCFLAVLPLAYFTAGGEVIEGRYHSFIFSFDPPIIRWDFWEKLMASLGVSDSLINRRVIQFIALNCVCFNATILMLVRPRFVPWLSCSSVSASFSPFTSMLVHGSLLHLVGNMLGLYALTIGWHNMGPPARGSLSGVSYHQLTFLLLSAGMVSAVLCSARYLIKGSRANSVGFSNALYALLLFELATVPDAHIGIVFTDIHFTAQQAVYGIVGIELILLLFARFHRIDSFGHLMGALYGWWYARVGKEIWTDFRDAIADELDRVLL